MKNKVIAFDCDGTLVNTYKLIQQTFRIAFKELFPNIYVTDEEFESFFGPGLHETFSKYAKTKEEVNYCIERYRYHNHLIMKDYIECFDGIVELLDYLKEHGYNIMIVSNKITSAVKYGLELCNIDKYIEAIIGYEMIIPKPDPDGIYQAMKMYNVDNLLFIGDTSIDMKTGVNANVPTVGVTWCRSKKEELYLAGADFVIDHPLELINILENENIF